MSIAGVALGNVTAIASAPIFAAIIEKIFAHKRLDFPWFCISTLIILMIIGNRKFHSTYSIPSGHYFLGIFLALIAGFTYALYTFISRHIIEKTHNLPASMGALFGLGAVLLSPIVLLADPPILNLHTIPIMAYLIIAPMFMAYLLFGYGLHYVTASRATILALVEPLVSIILGVIITHDHLLWYGWIGTIITIIAMSLPEDFSFHYQR